MKKLRIILADDHELVRFGIRNALLELPNLDIVAEVGDGPSLLAILEHEKPDGLLIDVSMPDFEPISSIRLIRTSYPDMKILVVSAHNDDVYVQGLLSAGVNGYHLKDQPLSDLRLALKRVLAGEKWLSSRLLDKLVNYKGVPRRSNSSLTNRQRDILRLLQQGLDNQSIARQMNLSVKTIENHLTRLYRQLKVQSRLEAVNYVGKYPEILAISGQNAAQNNPPPQNSNSEQINMLLVDDNTRYRHQLRRMVGKVWPEAMIYEAENIREAVQLTQRIKPQLALVDVVLGDEDGIQCTRRLCALSPASHVVLMSAYPDREFHRLGLEAGAVAFLDKKDFDRATLQQVIADMVG